MSEKDAIKQGILVTLKYQWKRAVEAQYLTNPKAVKEANIEKNAKDIMNNSTVRMVTKTSGITVQDIERILREIQSEVISGG